MNSIKTKRKYSIYQFHFLDDFRCCKPIHSFFEEFGKQYSIQAEQQLYKQIADCFDSAGWEGDGEIECIFIPPFIFALPFFECYPIFHVKQKNNGTSFLLVPDLIAFYIDSHLELSKSECFLEKVKEVLIEH